MARVVINGLYTSISSYKTGVNIESRDSVKILLYNTNRSAIRIPIIKLNNLSRVYINSGRYLEFILRELIIIVETLKKVRP